MKRLDNLIQDYKIGHHNTSVYSDALKEFIEKKYDIMTCYGTLVLNPGDNLVATRDFISDIRTDDEKIYLVVDNEEFTINDNTRILTSLSRLKPIILRNKNDKFASLIFKRWLVKMDILDILGTYTIIEGEHYYLYGCINNNI